MSTRKRLPLRVASVTAILLAGVAAPVTAPEPAAAFCETPGGEGREDDELCHGRIVRAAVLPFLRHSVAHELDEYILVPDTNSFPDFYQAQSDLHFDSCNFDGGADTINDNYYDNIPVRLTLPSPFYGRPGLFPAMRAWGFVLHAAQDFYAHSNWVEMAVSDVPDVADGDSTLEIGDHSSNWYEQDDVFAGDDDFDLETLVDTGLRGWADLPSEWGRVPSRSDMVASQHDLPDGWSYLESEISRTRHVVSPDGEVLRLLVSGVESPPHVFQGCPDGMQLHHDDLFNPFTGVQINEGLNKDNTSQGFYDEAVYMAIRQTRHEWCRMLHIVHHDTDFGAMASSVLFGLGVAPGASPHPAETPCAPAAPGPVQVNIAPTAIAVREDRDDGDNPGDLTLAFAVYNDDFTRSFVSESGILTIEDSDDGTPVDPTDLPAGASLCTTVADNFFATVQGWDDDDDPAPRGDLDDDDDELIGVHHPVGSVLELAGGTGVGTFQVESGGMRVRFTVDLEATDADDDGLTRCDELLRDLDPENPDSDDDGLTDGDEVNVYGTDPLEEDTDGDDVDDGDEIDGGSDPLDGDTDDDGLDDGDENDLGTDPTDPDSDDDGLTDGAEVHEHGTDPTDPDSDDDGLPDGLEIDAGTDPNDADSDDDGLPDGSDVEFVQTAVDELVDQSLRDPAGGTRQAIMVILDDVEAALLDGEDAEAVRMLENVRRRANGCGAAPDANDWILICVDQIAIRALVDLLIANLETASP